MIKEKLIYGFVGAILLLHGCGHEDRKAPSSSISVSAPLKQTPPPSQPSKSVPSFRKVGILLPLSGEHQELGKALLNAAEMALFESDNPDVVLIPQDTAHGAPLAAERALAQGAEILLGPIFATEAKGIQPLLNQGKVNLICFSTDQSVAGRHVFVLSFLPHQQMEHLLLFAKTKGIRKIAALIPEDIYGQTIRRSLETLSAKGEIDLLGITPYSHEDVLEGNPGNELLIEAVERYQKQGLQALLIPEGGEHLHQMVRFLSPLKIPLILGSGQWETPDTLDIPELKGAFFASTPPEERKGFEQRYARFYGNPPPRIATLAYDATALAVGLYDEGYTREALTRPQGFRGIDGVFRLIPSGLNERDLVVFEVGEKEFTVINTPFQP